MYRVCPGSALAKHQESEQHPGTNPPEPRRLTASSSDCGASAEDQHELSLLWVQHSRGLLSTGSQGMPSYLEDHWMRDQEPSRKWACMAKASEHSPYPEQFCPGDVHSVSILKPIKLSSCCDCTGGQACGAPATPGTSCLESGEDAASTSASRVPASAGCLAAQLWPAGATELLYTCLLSSKAPLQICRTWSLTA